MNIKCKCIICVHVDVYVYTHIYMCLCMCLYIYVSYTYTHTVGHLKAMVCIACIDIWRRKHQKIQKPRNFTEPEPLTPNSHQPNQNCFRHTRDRKAALFPSGAAPADASSTQQAVRQTAGVQPVSGQRPRDAGPRRGHRDRSAHPAHLKGTLRPLGAGRVAARRAPPLPAPPTPGRPRRGPRKNTNTHLLAEVEHVFMTRDFKKLKKVGTEMPFTHCGR